MHRLRPATAATTLGFAGCLLTWSFGLAPAVAQEVTLPLSRYDELRRLSRSEPAPAPKPPAPVAFEEAVLTIRVAPDGATPGRASARIVHDLTVTIFNDDWQNLPLGDAGRFVDADFGALQGRLDTASRSAGSGATLALRGAGRHRLRLTSAVPVTLDEAATRPTWRLRLEAPRAALVRATIETPPGVEEIDADGAIVSSTTVDGQWTFVAKAGAEVRLALFGAAKIPRRESLPLAFEATTAVALEVSHGRRRAQGWLDARVRQGRLEELRVPIPAGFEVVEVGGDEVAGWDTDDGRLLVTPLAPVAERLRLELKLAAGAATELEGPVLIPDGAASVLAASKVYVRGDGLLRLLDAGAARQPDARQQEELPPTFRKAPGLALVTTQASSAEVSRWQVSWAEGAEVLAAQVDRLRLDVVVGEAGRAGYQLWAEVRNRGAWNLGVELPAGAELIAARRDGRRVEPGRSSDAWTVPLAGDGERQVIHLSGVVPLALPDAGRFDLPLPALSAPAARVEVSVWLPGGRGYQLADGDRYGTVAAVPVPRPEARDAALPELFSGPPGFQQIEAAWSALAAAPAPLAIRIMDDNDRWRWF